MVVVQVAVVTLHYGIEYLVAVGAGQLHGRVEFLGHFEGEVGVVKVSRFEPLGGVAICPDEADGGSIQSSDDGGVEVEVGAVFATKE